MKRVSTQFNQFRFFFAFLLMVGLTSQATAQKIASVSGNWSSNATWGNTAPPTSGQTVTINAGVTVTMDVNATCASVATADLSGTTATISGTGTLTTGSVTINGGNNQPTTLSIGASTTVICSSVVVGNGNNNTTYTLNVLGTLKNSGTTGTGGTLDAFTCGASSTVEYNGTAQTVFPTTYNNLTLSGSGIKTITSVSTVNGNLTTSGTATATTTVNLAIGGNLSVGTGSTLATASTFTLGVTGTTSVVGTLTLAGTGVKTFGGLLTVSGTYNNSGNSNITLQGGINKTGGSLTAGTGLYTLNTSDQSLTGSMTIDNITVTGVVLSIPAGTTLTSAGTITNNGTIANQGVIAKTGGFSNGSTYKSAVGVTGSFTTSLFTNTGSVSPGGSIGCLSFGAGFTNAGAVNIEVNGSTTACTDFDKITVTGTATLAGTLNITTGFSPVADFSIDILTATTILGTFATVTVPDAHWTVTYPAGAVRLNYSAILPVELAQFSANTEGSKTKLSWQTASEFNTKNFDIERSADGLTFEKIGEVLAYGKPNDYNFVDESPRNGINYYRLKTNDLDGSADYSKIASVTFEGKAGKAKVYPNPVGTEGVLNVETGSDIQTVFISNAIGQVVLTSKLSKINVSQLPTGLYHVTVQAGNDVKTEKFFKQ